MRNKKVFFLMVIVVLVAALTGAAFFVFKLNPNSPDRVRARLNEAQRVLGVLRSVEISYQDNSEGGDFFDVSAKADGQKMIFSDTWRTAGLPEVEAKGGFEFICFAARGSCQATEIGSGDHGLRIDIESGNYECLGKYRPVVTSGFSGEEVIVGCQVQD